MRVTKRFSWAMAHRLGQGYPKACKNIHGHTYHCEVTIESSTPNEYGMVIDFGVIKSSLAGWVNSNLDHGVLLVWDDQELMDMLAALGSKFHMMPDKYDNTTAENIAHMLFHVFAPIVEEYQDTVLDEVKVWETEMSYAAFSRRDHWRCD